MSKIFFVASQKKSQFNEFYELLSTLLEAWLKAWVLSFQVCAASISPSMRRALRWAVGGRKIVDSWSNVCREPHSECAKSRKKRLRNCFPLPPNYKTNHLCQNEINYCSTPWALCLSIVRDLFFHGKLGNRKNLWPSERVRGGVKWMKVGKKREQIANAMLWLKVKLGPAVDTFWVKNIPFPSCAASWLFFFHSLKPQIRARISLSSADDA